MKFTKLKLRDFVAHRDLTLDEIPLLMLLNGPTGAGKSTIKNAILFALTGIMNRDIIHYDAKSCQVDLVLDNKVMVTRTKSQSGSPQLEVTIISGPNKGQCLNGDNSTKQAHLLRQMGVTAEQLEAIFETGRFLDFPEATQRQILFDALGVEVTEEKVMEWLKSNYEATDWDTVRETVQPKDEKGKRKDLDFDFAADTIINNKIAVERRRAAKRTRDDLNATLDRYMDAKRPSVMPAIADMEARLKEIQAERDGLIEQRTRRARLPQLHEQLRQVNASIEAAGKFDPDIWKKLEEIGNALAPLREKERELKSKIASGVAEKTHLEKEKARVESLGDECPTCGKKMSKAAKDKALGGYEDQLKGVIEEQGTLGDEWEALTQEMSKLEEQQTALTNIKERQANLEAYGKQRQNIEAEIDALNAIADPAEALSKLEAKQAEGEALLSQVKAYKEAQAKVGEIEEKMAEVAGEIDWWDAIEKAYGPKGVKTELLDLRLSEVEQMTSDHLSILGFGPLSFQTENDKGKPIFNILINGHPYRDFSSGQQHMINIALQATLAVATGVKFLILEEMHRLDGAEDAAVKKLLLQALVPNLDSIIVMRTSSEKPAAAKADFVGSYWVNGNGMEVVA